VKRIGSIPAAGRLVRQRSLGIRCGVRHARLPIVTLTTGRQYPSCPHPVPRSCNNSIASTRPHPGSTINSATYFTGRSIDNACRPFKAMISYGSLTIWTGYVAAPLFRALRLSHPRLSTASILPVPVSGNVSANSEARVGQGWCYRLRSLFCLRIWISAITLSPLEVPPMCTKGPSTIQRSASNASGCTLRTVRRKR
jgi:hypothetical protein